MFGRRAKDVSEQVSPRRQVQRGSGSPAFSYYTSRVIEKPIERPAVEKKKQKKQQPTTETEEHKSSSIHSFLASIPFWLLIIVAVVSVGKMLTLSTDPKIVVVGETSTSSKYLQPSAVYETAAQKLLASSVVNRSKLTVDAEGISLALQQEFPELVDVSISVPLVNSRPIVYIQPASPSLILQQGQGNFAINKTGIVLTALPKVPSGVPIVVDQSGPIPRPGKQVLPSSTVSFVQTVLYQFANAAHLTISSFVLPTNSPYELDVHLTGKPYVIRFNVEDDALTQSGAAIATIQQLGTTVPSSYIDVQVSGRVYYK